MKFDRLISKYITEAQNLPPRMRLDVEDIENPQLERSGALAKFLSSLDPDVVGSARGKASQTEEGKTVSARLDTLRAKIGSAYKKLMNNDFEPQTDLEKSVVETYKQWGLGEEEADILYLVGSQIARNLFNLKNLQTEKPKDKIIPVIDVEDPDRSVNVTIAQVARDTLQKFHQLFQENEENGRWNGLGSNSLVLQNNKINYVKSAPSKDKNIERVKLIWKQTIDLLRYLTNLDKELKANSKFAWKTSKKQYEGSNNYLALDARSTPTNWIIFTKKGEGGGEPYLRSVYGKMSDRTNRLTSDWENYPPNKGVNKLPLKFINGVPQYGSQLQTRDMFDLSNKEFLEKIGYETIYDVIYAKTVENKDTFRLPDGKILNLKDLNISTQWQLTVSPTLRQKKEIKVAKTGFRPESRPVEMSQQEREKLKRNVEKLPTR